VKICPYLGLIQDSKTPAIFPTERNLCYHPRPARAVLNTHQQEYCLAAKHQDCPVFKDPAAAPNSEFLYTQSLLGRKQGVFPFVLTFLVLLCAGLGVWYYRDALFAAAMSARTPLSQPLAPAPIATPLQAQSPESAATTLASGPLATMLVTPTATPRPTDTSPPPTETASVTPPPGLGMPIGRNPALVIHRVAPGESLNTIASLYGSSETAIRAVNLMLPIPLWENWLVIVPYQTEEVGDLPLFEAYQVNVEGITVANLARQLAVDVTLLAQYNNLEQSDFFANGQWVLVPYMRP
jgi:hypothetical protein